MCKPEEFINDWIGVPHVYDGRGADGVDCYGLVKLYYQEVLNKELPDWICSDSSKIWIYRAMEVADNQYLCHIVEPTDDCIVLARRKTIAHHVGIYYRGNVLHSVENQSVMYEPLRNFELAYGKLIYGVPDVSTIVKY